MIRFKYEYSWIWWVDGNDKQWRFYPDNTTWPTVEQTVAWLKQYLEEYEAHNKKNDARSA